MKILWSDESHFDKTIQIEIKLKSIQTIRKIIRLSIILIGAVTPVMAGTPAYKASPYLEDYSHIRNITKKTNRLDSIKYIPLTEDTYLSLGGETRQHF